MVSHGPAKSQPLHNFSLPYLKWKKTHNNHQRGRSRFADASPPPDDLPLDNAPPQTQMMHYFAPRQSPMRERVPRESPIRDSVPRQSPMRDSVSRQSPMRDSAPRHSPMRDSAPCQSPMREPAPRHSPMREPVLLQYPIRHSPSESDPGYVIPMKNRIVTENRKRTITGSVKNGFFASSSDQMIGKLEKKSVVDVVKGNEVRSKIYIRIRKNKPVEVQSEKKLDEVQSEKNLDEVQNDKRLDDVQNEGKMCVVEGEVDELGPKTWNLRPRKRSKLSNTNGGTSRVQWPEHKAKSPERTHNRPDSEANAGEKEKKLKFSIGLSKEEIEEDIFAITGSKPTRRPKKRPRNVQKLIDNVFPGLWLGSITPDIYKVPENPPKV